MTDPHTRKATSRLLGVLACAAFALHALVQWRAGRPENLLWACHVADLCVGLGLLFRIRALAAAGVLILSIGVPLWLVNLACGGAFYPTSVLTHLGGLTLGLIGLRQIGTVDRAWLAALVVVATLLVASRVITPAGANVNLVYHFWKSFGPGGLAPEWHVLSVLTLWLAMLWGVEHGGRWVFGRQLGLVAGSERWRN